MSQPFRGQGGHLVFPIGPQNTNFVEDIEILLPVKFRWIPFSGFKGEVENVSANQRPGRPSCFSDRSEKHKLCRGRWDLASCQVSLNSIQRFQRRSRKCLRQSEARAAILFFRSVRKTQTSQQAQQRWFNVDSTSIFNVVSTLKLGWIWKLGGCCFDVVSTLFRRCFNVVSTLFQFRINVYPTFYQPSNKLLFWQIEYVFY